MKYESELIKEIVDTKGHEKSLLHYESECVESWIDEAKGAYPKLTDYRGEWLNYIVENPIGEFPYITLSDVTDATVDNVVPYAYKSAILMGSTKWTNTNGDVFDAFFNPVTNFDFENGYLKTDGTLTYDGGHFTTQFIDITNFDGIEMGKEGAYFGKLCFYDGDKNFIAWVAKDGTTGIVKVESIPSNAKYIRYSAITKDIFIKDNEGRDLALPLSLVSVKMPVLTTTGKNLFNLPLLQKQSFVIESDANSFTIQNEDGRNISELFGLKHKPNEQYTIIYNRERISGNGDSLFVFNYTDGTIQYTDPDIINVTKPGKTLSHISLSFSNIGVTKLSNICLIQGIDNELTYEPYKSNILTVNEEVELRGIGDVQDTLDCLTGQLTERIEEIVLDGGDDEEWIIYGGGSDTHQRFVLKRGNRIKPISNVNDNLFSCDKFKNVTNINGENSQEMCLIEYYDDFFVSIIIENTKLNSVTVDGFKSWLQSNNVKIQYAVENESIKTVDLLITNQDGNTLSKIKPIEGTMHLATSSDTLKPTFSGEIPVEATTQNLASFIEE